MTFQVHSDLRALVIEHPNPAVVLQMIPTAFSLGGNKIGMPHGIDETIRLGMLQINVPSPILHYYNWPREKNRWPNPFDHQKVTAAFMVSNPHAFVLNDIGSSKTGTACWAADYLLEIGVAHRVLVIAPLSTLERVWGDTLFTHFTHRTFSVLHGTAERRRKLLAQPADVYIINHDGIQVIQKEFAARPDIDIIIIDEIATLRNKNTGAWKAVETLLYPTKGKPKPWVWGLTGAPVPNAPTDAYAQCRLISPNAVPQFFGQFRQMVMAHTSLYKWVPRAEAMDVVYKVMRPSIRFKRDDCVDLPETTYQTRDVELSTDQTRHLKELTRQLYTEVEGGKITAVNEGVKLSKMLQVAGGCAYDSDGAPHEIDPGSRLKVLMEVIEEAGGKILCFVPFTAMTGVIARELGKFWETAIVTGDVSVKERNEIFSRFQDEKSNLEIIVAHPETMAHGLNLTAASVVVWWTSIFSNDSYTQACGRVTRPGQRRKTCVVNLAGSTIERQIYKRLVERQKVQGTLLAMIERKEDLI